MCSRYYLPANIVCAAASSICLRWVAYCPTALTCLTMTSRPSPLSTWIHSARCTRCRRSVCYRHVNFRWTRQVRRTSAKASASVSRAIRPGRTSTRTSARATPRGASNITCRCSSTGPRHCSITCRITPHCVCIMRWMMPSPPSARMPHRATSCCAVIQSARCWSPRNYSWMRNSSLSVQRSLRGWTSSRISQAMPSSPRKRVPSQIKHWIPAFAGMTKLRLFRLHKKTSPPAPPPRCPTSPSTAAPMFRRRHSRTFCRSIRGVCYCWPTASGGAK